MDYLNNLFTTKRILYDKDSKSRDRKNRSKSTLNQEQVRLLLFKECDWRGRKLLFDSSTIVKLPAKNEDKAAPNPREPPCIVEVADGYSYLYKGPEADAGALGEMIFGAVALNHKGVSLKVHIMDDPKRLMCTKVFFVPTGRRSSRPDRSAVDRTDPDLNASAQHPSTDDVALSFSFDRGDSGFYGEHSLQSSVSSTGDFYSMCEAWRSNCSQDDLCDFQSPSSRKLSTSSSGSWHRRRSRSLATRFDLSSHSSNLLEVPTSGTNFTSSDSQICMPACNASTPPCTVPTSTLKCSNWITSNSSASSTSDSLASGNASQRRNKLGIALIISVADPNDISLIRRCVEHSSQLAALVCRVRMATLNATRLLPTLTAAVNKVTVWLSDLLFGPKLHPTWLSLTSRVDSNVTADRLVRDVCTVLALADTKHTRFFFSTLLTQVLTHHLGWVTTVSPYDVLDPQQHQESSNSRPYNALWAQLNDLCGSIGFPPKATRTIIAGATNELVHKLLDVLTYFLRCGEVRRKEFGFQKCTVKETKVINIQNSVVKPVKTNSGGLKRVATKIDKLTDFNSNCLFSVPEIRTQDSDACLNSDGPDRICLGGVEQQPMSSRLHKSATLTSALNSETEKSKELEVIEPNQKVLFVLGDNEKLVGLKNKSNNGKRVKRSSKVHNEPVDLGSDIKDVNNLRDKELSHNIVQVKFNESTSTEVISSVNINNQNAEDLRNYISPVNNIAVDSFQNVNNETESNHIETRNTTRDRESPSKCCSQTLQHSKPMKHSGFKFEFDKYPQIVTNYMKSKNLEILNRHYIGKPGNLKLDNFQFDPMVVPPIQEEKCEICYKCQMMESILQTPTNASELEFMNDMPRQMEPQYAKASVVSETEAFREMSPKTFVMKRKPNTVVVNMTKRPEDHTKCDTKSLEGFTTMPESSTKSSEGLTRASEERDGKMDKKEIAVRNVVEFPMPSLEFGLAEKCGFDNSLLGGVTDHYVPDLILQGTSSSPQVWEQELRRDLDLFSYLNKGLSAPIQAVAIIGDTNSWEVRVVGGGGGGAGVGGGVSALVAAMLDALPHMWRARVPPQQCLFYVESKLREFCVLSKTLADLLMSTDFCDMATLTKTLNIDVNDVPLLMAVATTHTPQMAQRYGISYR